MIYTCTPVRVRRRYTDIIHTVVYFWAAVVYGIRKFAFAN